MSDKTAAGAGGSSFSFTSHLFGAKDSTSLSSNHIFCSIFSSSSKPAEVGGKSQAFPFSPKTENEGSKYKECKNQSTSSRETAAFYQEQRPHPCHFSSSIYYGGQDVYTQNPTTTGLNSSLKKDGGEDDSGGASRGNWWQESRRKKFSVEQQDCDGSLYY